ncbi:MAG: 16S rRNA (cytidine(1402)-2'-O)-methyltransferase [Nitratireductor sp.]
MSGFVIAGNEFQKRELAPGLYVVSTPIGNLGDITIRALETLSSVDLVACEDTRVTAKLLQRYGMDTRMMSYHEHNSDKAGAKILQKLQAGARIALVSDAGTPLVSDPGFRLVRDSRVLGVNVVAIPGASSPLAALAASGLPAESFLFAGFLPTRDTARRNRLASLSRIPATLVFFESPNRLGSSLAAMVAELGPERQIAVCRELTKMHEEIVGGTAAELAARYGDAPVKGEIVIVVAPPADNGAAVDPGSLLQELLASMSVSRAAAEAAKLTGIAKRDLYQQALDLSQGMKGQAGHDDR